VKNLIRTFGQLFPINTPLCICTNTVATSRFCNTVLESPMDSQLFMAVSQICFPVVPCSSFNPKNTLQHRWLNTVRRYTIKTELWDSFDDSSISSEKCLIRSRKKASQFLSSFLQPQNQLYLHTTHLRKELYLNLLYLIFVIRRDEVAK